VTEDAPRQVLSRNLSWFARHDEIYLFHDLIGYILKMSADVRDLVLAFDSPLSAAEVEATFPGRWPAEMLREMLQTLEAHRILVPPDARELDLLPDMVPVKARWRVAYTDPEGQVTLVLARSPAEVPRRLVLTPRESWLWTAIDGQRSQRDLAAALAEREELPLEEALEAVQQACAAWTHSSAQVLKLHELPLSFYKGHMHALPPYLLSTVPFPALDTPRANPQFQGPTVDLRDYHRRGIVDATQQFDEVESTLNHLFRVRHPALHGRDYPGQMLHTLLQRGMLRGPAPLVVEVGGGTGSFAEGFLQALREEAPELVAGLRYRIVELSPTLAAAQRARLARFGDQAEVIDGDAEELALAPGSVSLLIANEMIGDLRTAQLHADELDPPGQTPRRSNPEAVALIRKYRMRFEDAPPVFYLNLGAMRLLERISEVLAPDGHAIVTEFGEEHAYPRESEHLDHAEFSIHFGHLRHVARKLGFVVRFEFVIDLLDMDRSLQTLATTRSYLRNLQALFAQHGLRLEKRVYTRADLQELAGEALDLDRVEALHFDRIEDRVCGLVPHHFKALLLHRPRV